jgi:hypothetical protein
MCHAAAPRLAVFENATTVQFECHAEQVLWLLDEPEPG